MEAMRIAAYGATIVLALVAVFHSLFKVVTKDDLAQLELRIANLESRLTSVLRETTRTLGKQVISNREDIKTNRQNHVEHLAHHDVPVHANKASP